MDIDPVMLGRIQFVANITFHILFPSITIALGWVLLFFKIQHTRTQKKYWIDAYFFWTKIFALCFAMGVVSGITMSFQFGTNWPGFMETVGNIAGPLLAYEVLTAFFLEATFLGIMLFGFRRVPSWLHTLATFLVAFGTTSSAFWILVLNSWMQTPVGFEMIDGQAYATDWMAILFNPSFPYRFFHMLLASGLTASFLVSGISAYRYVKGDRSQSLMCALRTGVLMSAFLIPIQIIVGDFHGLNTLEYQPQKVAAMEAAWVTQERTPLVLFALPNEKTKKNDYALEIPGGASLILKHDINKAVPGLDQFEGNHPPVAVMFWTFRIMVGVGLLMLLFSWMASIQLFRYNNIKKWLAYGLVGMTFSGWIATVSGWYVTEIGRQPWLVTGVLKTADAAADIPKAFLGMSLSLYLFVYAVLLFAFMGTLFFMARKAVTQVKEDEMNVASATAIVQVIREKGDK